MLPGEVVPSAGLLAKGPLNQTSCGIAVAWGQGSTGNGGKPVSGVTGKSFSGLTSMAVAWQTTAGLVKVSVGRQRVSVLQISVFSEFISVTVCIPDADEKRLTGASGSSLGSTGVLA